MQAGAKQIEIELTLRLKPDDVPTLLRAESLAAARVGAVRKKRLRSTYFDTPDLQLRRQQIVLRVRKVGRRFIQTIKTASKSDQAFIARGEWERVVSTERPDVAAFDGDRDVRMVLDRPGVADSLTAVFTTEFTRTTIPIQLGQSRLELAVDVGTIHTAAGSEPICEVEIELKSGAIAQVYEAADLVRRCVPANLEPLSKSARAFVLLDGGVVPTLRATRLRLDRRQSLGEGFLSIARACLHQLRMNSAAVARSDDPEAVHQLRIALRRLRSAFSAFAEPMPLGERRVFARQLRALARTTDAARELDVFLGEILTAVQKGIGDDPGLAGVAVAAARARQAAWLRVREMVASDGFTQTVLSLEAWLEGGGWRQSAGNAYDEKLRDFAQRTLKRLHRKLVRTGARIDELAEAELHALRLRAKKQRYAGEFFRAVFDAKAAKSYLVALGDVQDHLGVLNDSVTVRHLLARLGRNKIDDRAAFERGAAVVLGWCAARVTTEIERLPTTWARFVDQRVFWK